ncbi:MAG: cytochrome c oxidase assembly protein [Paracoccus hibiscisoli]|uniref:cytochrome c oxidase assembly protein n=1 Tax=Paracoccus hibiscisoli TaxID=2023261 RepID=UPI00391CE803
MSGWSHIYCGPAPDPGDIWMRWNLDPVLIALLAVLGLMVGRSRAGALSVLVLIVAFVSPICALSAALFSARFVHHVLLVAVAAPLLAMACPRRAVRSGTIPFLISAVVLWAWHLPPAYDLALSNVAVYWVMQASLLVTAVAFWQAVLHPRQGGGAAVLLILAAYMQMGLLGALLTFAPAQLYAIHAVAPLAWGMAPLADQQLGGLIMWVPASLPYILFGTVVARRGWRVMRRASA